MAKKTGIQTKYPLLYAYLEKSAYHLYDDFLYESADKLLSYMRKSDEFQKFNNSDNSEQDVWVLFNELTDKWVADICLENITNVKSFEHYNVLTGEDVDRAFKNDVFNILWNEKEIRI